MAEAKITLQLTPREFDVLRNAVRAEHSNALEITNDRSTDQSIRHAARQQAVELNDLLARLQ